MKKKYNKRCKYCGNFFIPVRPLQIACGFDCAIEYALQKAAKESKIGGLSQRKLDRAKLKSLKTIPQLIKEAQVVFNKFIRERDKFQLCICCDRPLGTNESGGDYDCGHFRSRGSSPHLRFNEDNAFAQSKYCNRYLSGNALGMRAGMIKRIGIERVLAVESNNAIHKWTKDELVAIKTEYQIKYKLLVAEREKILR